MTILITGGAGFVGHHIVEHILKNTDWKIVLLDRLTYAGNLNRITDISVFDPKRIKFVYHDLRSPIQSVHRFIGKIDYVIHLAAESHVDRSLKDALPFAQSNVVGTTNLLQYLRDFQDIKKYFGFNTDEVFGAAPPGLFYREIDKFYPSNPYSAAKAGQWCMEYAFRHAFRMPITIVHSMNIVGERQHPEKFLPKTIKAILEHKKVSLHGFGRTDMSSRCWIHARNVADALMFLMDKPNDIYNIVGEERTVLEIANWISEEIQGRELKDDEIEWIDYHSARPGHDKRYALDGGKLAKLGWTPPVNLRDSIKKTVKWSIKHKEWL